MSSHLDILMEEIDAKRRLITTLTESSVSHEQADEKAKHIQQLAEVEEEYALLVESKRIESVVRDHEELHPPITERCPICQN